MGKNSEAESKLRLGFHVVWSKWNEKSWPSKGRQPWQGFRFANVSPTIHEKYHAGSQRSKTSEDQRIVAVGKRKDGIDIVNKRSSKHLRDQF